MMRSSVVIGKVFVAIVFFVACTSAKNEKEEQKYSSESTQQETKEAPKSDVFIAVSDEDSASFYTALKEQKQVDSLFCLCAVNKGRDHKDCRDYIIKSSTYGNKETEVLNKYYNLKNYDTVALRDMFKAMQDQMKKTNACGEKR